MTHTETLEMATFLRGFSTQAVERPYATKLRAIADRLELLANEVEVMRRDNEIIQAVAKLDGWLQLESVQQKDGDFKVIGLHPAVNERMECRPYTTSRDAIVPVIEKQDGETILKFWECLWDILELDAESGVMVSVMFHKALTATPRQLAEALLRALNLWEETK